MSRPDDHGLRLSHPIPVTTTPPTEPAMPSGKRPRNLADLVERITITEVRPGDVVVVETKANLTDDEFDSFKAELARVMPEGVHAAILEQAQLRGVIRLTTGAA